MKSFHPIDNKCSGAIGDAILRKDGISIKKPMRDRMKKENTVYIPLTDMNFQKEVLEIGVDSVTFWLQYWKNSLLILKGN